MSAYDEHEYETEQQDGPKALREALEKANKEKAELAKQVAELNSKVSQFSLAQVLSDKKVPANVAKWLKRDNVEPTAEAVDKWLNENGADFGWKPGAVQEASEGATAEEAQAQGQATVPTPESVLSPELIAAYETIQAALNGASGAATSPLDAYESATAQIASQDLSVEDTIAALRNAGIPLA